MRRGTGLMLALALAVLVVPKRSEACGGCFAAANVVQTVNSHQMVLSLSSRQTTLWDRFSWSGNPSEFAWILPIQYGPNVVLRTADPLFFTVLDNLTAPIVVQPTHRCFCPLDGAPTINFDATVLVGPDVIAVFPNPDVAVLEQGIVGPYEFAILRGSDANSLRQWLTTNEYRVPSTMEPVLQHYLSMRSDFLAVKLRPNIGTSQMVPLSVTTPGYQPVLPLRMIGAGIADKVGLQLFVLADSRMEAENFSNGEIQASELRWDFNNPGNIATDFLRAFDQRNRAANFRLWLTETSFSADVSGLRWNAYGNTGGGIFYGAGPCIGEDGQPRVPPPVATADMAIATQGFSSRTVLTRFRADLSLAALDRDLRLAPSRAGNRPRIYEYGTFENIPVCDPGCTIQTNINAPGVTRTIPALIEPVIQPATLPDAGATPPSCPEDGGGSGRPFNFDAALTDVAVDTASDINDFDAGISLMDVRPREVVRDAIIANEPPVLSVGGGLRCAVRTPGARNASWLLLLSALLLRRNKREQPNK